MTNATIFENNSTSNDEINKQNCNATGDSQNCTDSTVEVPKADCSNSNDTDCNAPVTTEANQAIDTKKNQIGDSDTVLKYVYKKDEKTNNPNKSTGHPKNSINRRKRSTDDGNESPLPSKIVKPAAVNYETAHGVPTAEPFHRPPHTLSGANLADFSIQTNHDHKPIQHSPEKDSSEIGNDNDKSNESRVSGENTPNDSAERPVQDSQESGEHQDYRKHRGENGEDARDYPQHAKSSGESNDDDKSSARDESDEYRDQQNRLTSQEVNSSGERQAFRNNKPSHEQEDSREHANYNNKLPSRPYDESAELNNYKSVKPRGEYNNNRDVQDFNNHDRNNNGERGNYNRKPIQYENSSEEDYRNKKPSPNNSDEREHRGNINTSSAKDSSNEREDYKNSKPSRESDRSEPSRGYDRSNERADYINRTPDRDSSNERRDDKPSSEYSNSEEISKERDSAGEKKKNSFGSTDNGPINNAKFLAPQFLSKEASDEQAKTGPNSAESDSSETHERNNYKRNQPHIQKSTEYKQDDSSRENKRLDYQNDKINFNDKPTLSLESSSSKSSSESDEDELKTEDKQPPFANKFGIKLPQNGNLISTDPKKAVEILPLTTAIPQLDDAKPLITLPNDEEIVKPKINRLGNKLIHINDGEVKPVVEIHAENDNESSEENTKSSNSDEADSLESLLGVKGSENLQADSQSDKLLGQQETPQGDVKQQFERIPLNYKHDDKNDNKDTEAPKEEKSEVTKDEGTVDVFAPDDVKYDANLNIKFDDLAIKLPEIKLPDDILSYTQDSYPYNDKKESKHDSQKYGEPQYYYNHDDKVRTRQDKNKKDKDNDDTSAEAEDEEDDKPESNYYDYYGHKPEKSNYKRKDSERKGEEDENEDLYEKFVRERFGKRGTFEKRSEKLESAALSPHLYDTVKSILKKTADIDEQAKKSGDPNANYMWTLEYGEKL
ncbi:unnamed protein product [Chrysodeixis includens]|uniref:Uncharacterized protein n=1 Tax=Chrysodeixis includens TaxID=689277 RepID=A0A9N8PYU9_CHRIL|nr:unnamed protein product [Chrysodeixis includens]